MKRAAAVPALKRGNLFGGDVPLPEDDELFETMARGAGDFRLERIVSTGQITPPDRPYVQDEDEWVCLLSGSAELAIDHGPSNVETVRLDAGDWVLLPARMVHRVTRTSRTPPARWLALHGALYDRSDLMSDL